MREEKLITTCTTKLTRSLPEITMFRGEGFAINLVKSYESEKCRKMVNDFRYRGLTIQKDDLSYRVLSHWDSLGLLECERDNEKGWRRFNLIERLWAQVIIELRKIGLSLEKIGLSKPFFFEKISDKCWLTYAEYYCLSALGLGRPTQFIILADGQAEFLDYEEFRATRALTKLGHFISLDLNELLSTLLKRKLTVNYPLERDVTPLQHEICDLMDQEDFDFLKVMKEKNKVKGIKGWEVLAIKP